MSVNARPYTPVDNNGQALAPRTAASLVTYGETTNVETALQAAEQNVTTLQNTKSGVSHSVNVTLLAASWSNGSYTLTNEYITATNVVEMLPAEGISADQLKAAQKANIVGGAQSAGSKTLVALGTVPTIDIPVTFVFRGDL